MGPILDLFVWNTVMGGLVGVPVLLLTGYLAYRFRDRSRDLS